MEDLTTQGTENDNRAHRDGGGMETNSKNSS